MTAQFTLEEIVNATHGYLVQGDGGQSDSGRVVWLPDQIGPGDWFLAMSCGGEDSHDYIESAFERSARGCIIEGRRASLSRLDRTNTIISVDDTKTALWQLAGSWRRKVAPKVVAVTGSVGRKETIAFLEFLVRKQFRCHVAVDSGALGSLPGFFSMPADTELLIVEASGANRGEVARTGNFARPDMAVITAAHHPLPSPKRNARNAALYGEILETLCLENPVFEKLAVVNDRNPVLQERVDAILKDDNSAVLSGNVSNISTAALAWISEASGVSPDAEQVDVSAWCAVTAAACLGLSMEEMPHIVSEVIVKAGSYRA